MYDRGVGAVTLAASSRPAIVGALPRSLYLETTNRCDSKCQTCIRTFTTLEKPADLTLERVRAIVEQFPTLDRVVLHGIGEPLLNPEIFDIVAYLKQRVPAVLFNSDAIGLTRARAIRLIESGLDEYRVSMDAATAATFQKLRGVDCFERVTANVARLITLQRELGRMTPRVSLWFTASRANVEELPAFVQLAADLAVGEVYVQRLVFNGLGLATDANALHGRLREREQALLTEAETVATSRGITLRASGLTSPLASLRGSGSDARHWAGCQRPWTLAYVTANGNVLPCCISPWVTRDYAGLVLGNAFAERFEAIWDGERYQRFRSDFESDTPPESCRGCGLLWSI